MDLMTLHYYTILYDHRFLLNHYLIMMALMSVHLHDYQYTVERYKYYNCWRCVP